MLFLVCIIFVKRIFLYLLEDRFFILNWVYKNFLIYRKYFIGGWVLVVGWVEGIRGCVGDLLLYWGILKKMFMVI